MPQKNSSALPFTWNVGMVMSLVWSEPGAVIGSLVPGTRWNGVPEVTGISP